MGVTVTQSQDVAALSALPALAGSAGVAQHATVAALGTLRMAAAAGVAQSASLHARGAVGLAGVLHTATLQQAHGIAVIGPLASTIQVQSLNVNTARIVASLPRLFGTGTVNASGTVAATARLEIATAAAVDASQAVQARAFLPRLWAALSLAIGNAAHIDATLGPLAASLSVQPPPSGYAADGNYYVALALRPFYASLTARPCYAAMEARSFYIKSNPDMTPTFDTMDPREELVLTLDATPGLADGETLVSISEITAVLQFGAAGSEVPTLTGELINTEPLNLTVQGKPVTVAVGCGVQVVASAGASGCRYLIAATCTTTNPNKVLTLKGVLPVSAT